MKTAVSSASPRLSRATPHPSSSRGSANPRTCRDLGPKTSYPSQAAKPEPVRFGEPFPEKNQLDPPEKNLPAKTGACHPHAPARPVHTGAADTGHHGHPRPHRAHGRARHGRRGGRH